MADDSAARSDIPVPDPTAISTAAEHTSGGPDVGVIVGHGSAPQPSQPRGSRVGRPEVAGARREDHFTSTRPNDKASYGSLGGTPPRHHQGAARQPTSSQRHREVPPGGLRHQRAHEHPGRTGIVPGTRQGYTAAGRAFASGSSRLANSGRGPAAGGSGFASANGRLASSGRGHAAAGRGFASANSRLASSGRTSATAGINQASASQQGSGTASGGRGQFPAHHSSSMAHNMSSMGPEMPLGFDAQGRGSAVFEVASMDAPVPGGLQDMLNLVSTQYDSNNEMISGDDDEVDDDDDDDKDYDSEADMGTDDADGPAHQAFQGKRVAKKPRVSSSKRIPRTVMVMGEALPAFVRSGLVCSGNSDAIKELPNYLKNFFRPVGGYLFPCFPGYQFYSIKFENKLVCSITRTGLLANGTAPWFKINNLDQPQYTAEGCTPEVAFEQYCTRLRTCTILKESTQGQKFRYHAGRGHALKAFGFMRTGDETDVRQKVWSQLYSVCTIDEQAYINRNMPGGVPAQAGPVNSVGNS